MIIRAIRGYSLQNHMFMRLSCPACRKNLKLSTILCYNVSMTIEQTEGILVGPARVELKVTPVIEKQEKTTVKNEITGPTPRADRLLGIAYHLGDISLEEIRAERLAKYLK